MSVRNVAEFGSTIWMNFYKLPVTLFKRTISTPDKHATFSASNSDKNNRLLKLEDFEPRWVSVFEVCRSECCFPRFEARGKPQKGNSLKTRESTIRADGLAQTIVTGSSHLRILRSIWSWTFCRPRIPSHPNR